MTKEELLTKKISAISLGCDKNRVDLEYMLGKLRDFGFEIIDDIENAEIIIVNTCAFIQPAVRESIENILVALNEKQNKCEKVIVTGCLVERYESEIKKELSDVDMFCKVQANEQIVENILAMYDVDSKVKESHSRVLTTLPHVAYLKISDGCDNCCSYCTIPRIRGRYKSIPIDDLVKEAKKLADMGVKEIIVVAQDTTRYGIDLYDKPMLISLLDKLCQIKELEWVRLHYSYPELVDDKLLSFISTNSKMCKYIDIPLQHIDEDILTSMNRKTTEDQCRNLVENIKTNYPNIAIRSTFIIGYPGEKRKNFNKLLQFILQAKLNNVGFFPYHREEKTKAYYLKKQNTNYKKLLRLKKIQKAQTKVADELNKQRIGDVVNVMVDYFDTSSGVYICHDEYNSPGIDFEIILDGNANVVCGNIYQVKLISYEDRIFEGEVQ